MTDLSQKETTFQRIRRVLRQAINGEEQDFTTGRIDRAIVLLAIPMILEMAMAQEMAPSTRVLTVGQAAVEPLVAAAAA